MQKDMKILEHETHFRTEKWQIPNLKHSKKEFIRDDGSEITEGFRDTRTDGVAIIKDTETEYAEGGKQQTSTLMS